MAPTYLDRFNDLLSQADNASALAQTKIIGRLMWLKKSGWMDFTNKMFGAGMISIALCMLMITTAQWTGLSEGIALVGIMGIWGVTMSCAVAAHLKCKKYEQQAQKAGVYINFKADRTPSASFKMRIVDAYEAWEFPQSQLGQLKALAQRNDIPQGWWESACNLINDYREHCLHAERVQKQQQSEQRAEQRLAKLSNISVELIQDLNVPTNEPQKDSTRLLV